MAEITISTQAEFDALPAWLHKRTDIYIKSDPQICIAVTRRIANGHVVARGSSHVEARGSSHVEAWESSHVEARGSSHVEAWGSSHVEAWGSSHVEAWESSHVVAWESSHVVARGSSHVEAWGSVAVHVHSDYATVLLFAFACAFNLVKAKIQKKSKTATIIVPLQPKGTFGWLESQSIKPAASVVLFKRVSADFKTQEGRPWETSWVVGAKLRHPNPDLKSQECGPGKYHACSRPYFCDEFRSTEGDRYVAIKIKKADIYAWPNPDYPHKIGFLAGEVLYECDWLGEKVEASGKLAMNPDRNERL